VTSLEGAGEPGKPRERVLGRLAKAALRIGEAKQALNDGDTKRACKRLAKAVRLVRKVARRLESRKGAAVVVDDADRATLAAFTRTIEAELSAPCDSLG
jgi:hypothetical protein